MIKVGLISTKLPFFIEPCCALKYYPEIEICIKEQKGEQEAKRKESQRLEDENFGNHLIGRIRTYLWNLFEYPETSKAAQVNKMHFIYGLKTPFISKMHPKVTQLSDKR